jgi:hypothetical protein
MELLRFGVTTTVWSSGPVAATVCARFSGAGRAAGRIQKGVAENLNVLKGILGERSG